MSWDDFLNSEHNEYFKDEEHVSCYECGWFGSISNVKYRENLDEESDDMICPSCGEMIA